jgi:hypothetical protein
MVELQGEVVAVVVEAVDLRSAVCDRGRYRLLGLAVDKLAEVEDPVLL